MPPPRVRRRPWEPGRHGEYRAVCQGGCHGILQWDEEAGRWQHITVVGKGGQFVWNPALDVLHRPDPV